MNTPMPELRWQFQFNPAYAWFESFTNHFASPDVSIIVDYEDDKPPAFAWSSRHLTELNDERDVWERAIALKAIFDGAFYLRRGRDFTPSKLGFLYDASLNRHCSYPGFEIEGIASAFSSNAQAWICNWRSSVNPYTGFVSAMLGLAREDERSRGMLQFLGLNGCSWITLYALLDFMKSDGVTVVDIASMANSTTTEVNRFTHTANNYAAIGPLCRHGELGHQPPKNPITLDEASKLIIPATHQYLLNRVKSLDLAAKWDANKI